MKLRFSLRAMLVLTTVVGLACLWRSRPASVAERFVRAVNAGQFAHADAMFHDDEQAFVEEFMDRDSRNRATARMAPQSVGDWLAGICRVHVDLSDFEGLGAEVRVGIDADARGLSRTVYVVDDSELTGFFDPQINMER